MTNRERLIEICDTNCGYVDEVPAEIFADHLIAHGVIVLPCKVGDAVYWMHDYVITECYINRVQINRHGVFIHIKSKKDKVPHGAFNAKNNIGKTVFLTREEAEAAIAKKKDNK